MPACTQRSIRAVRRKSIGLLLRKIGGMSETSKLGVNYFCVGSFFIFLGCVMLCALGFTVVLPFCMTYNWPVVSCTVTNSTFNPSVCSCDDQYNFQDVCVKYPCLNIEVRYRVEVGPINYTSAVAPPLATNYTANRTNYLFLTTRFSNSSEDVNNEFSNDSAGDRHDRIGEGSANGTGKVYRVMVAKLYRSWDDSFHKNCSLMECGDEVWNMKESRRFKSSKGQLGQVYDCYYNPLSPNVTLLERTSLQAAIHALLWPLISLLTGLGLWFGLCCGCCKQNAPRNLQMKD